MFITKNCSVCKTQELTIMRRKTLGTSSVDVTNKKHLIFFSKMAAAHTKNKQSEVHN